MDDIDTSVALAARGARPKRKTAGTVLRYRPRHRSSALALPYLRASNAAWVMLSTGPRPEIFRTFGAFESPEAAQSL